MSEEMENQVASEDWRSAIPEDLQNDPTLADIQDVGSLAKGYVHAQRMIGSDKVSLPGQNATQEELDMFYNKLGRPETSEGYEMPKENMPENAPINDEQAKMFFEEAHRIGLNKQQAAALLRWQAERNVSDMEDYQKQAEQRMQDAEMQMRKEFGSAYEQNIQMARDAAEKFGGENFINMLNESGMGNDPNLIKTFANIAKSIANDEIIGGGGRQGFLMSPSEALQAIADKKRDPNFMEAYQNKENPTHEQAVKEMGKLYGFAYPQDE